MLEKAVTRIGVTANCAKASAPGALKFLAEKAKSLNLKVLADTDASEYIKDASLLDIERIADHVDVLMVMGGDGSMLKAVRMLKGAPVPVIGVNLGSLGFMTSVAETELEKAIESLAAGSYTKQTRTMASCSILRDGKETGRYMALNEIVISRGESSRILTIDMKIGEETGTLCSCDGIVISTPTGSTGHSLSAGGPILHPDGSAFVISLICPHALSARPIVIPDSMAISAKLVESAHAATLTADGQTGEILQPNDLIQVTRAAETALFVCLPDYSYFSVLRQKLHWRGSTV